ncbi:AMP-binding protein [Magnetospirillum sulfuroxidans]|uniref:AMP-binding protein n=1 Tax=Magnetospirillum sulfuroxidans TaxID=611300 RepID=A0ABS5IEI8_9PROT|nr:AMP-binding protein [Magnetospirillum sulfuroxidans]MBR9972830.1 AMP-binding protein [Magnetospirillum sulfuroxidans]
MLKAARSYEEACRTFRWRLPERYNMAFDVCDRQTMAGADGHRTALIVEAADGSVERHTFHMLRLLSNRLANVLSARGIGQGDRVAVALAPSVEAAAAVLAVLKMGAVLVPLPLSLGEEPLAWRLADSGARAAVAADFMAARINNARHGAPALTTLLLAGDCGDCGEDLWAALHGASDAFAPVVSGLDTPALLAYPESAMGKPTGFLHGHGALLGNLPAVEFGLGFFPQFGDILWTSADWMSFPALMWAVLPAWHHGVPVVAGPHDQDAQAHLGLMARQGVRVAWMPPDHLAQLTQLAATTPHPLPRVLGSGPQPLETGLRDLVAKVFGIAAHEIWGTLEIGAVVANNASVMEIRPGSPGKAAPGITVEAVDGLGRVLRAGDSGFLALAPKAPGACLGRWARDAWHGGRLVNGWLPSSQAGHRDLDGYIWPDAADPLPGVVTIDGQPVALSEIETALTWHPRVAAAGVTGLADGGLKAFIATAGGSGDVHLARELQVWVAARRGLREVPGRIEFVDAIPLRADGSTDIEELLGRPVRLVAPDPEERI